MRIVLGLILIVYWNYIIYNIGRDKGRFEYCKPFSYQGENYVVCRSNK